MITSETAATRVYSVGGMTRMCIRAFELRVEARVHEFTQPLIRVGSRGGNDLVLDDGSMSRIHFEIRADEHGYRLCDLESTNGTFVDGFRANDVYLRPGAAITAGRTTMLFEPKSDEVELDLAQSDRFGPLLGHSVSMRRLFAVLERAAPSDATVLIEGESGTGKELVARAIHEKSQRASGPYVVFDCAAVAESLLESELFGHERGAFTGAADRRIGCLEQADGGTLFLDELGELPLALQAKLLRALENREVRRVGGAERRKVDVRFVAATNRDLAQAVNRGSFREDLYYRLAVVRVCVPPLRERREDIPLLVRGFVERLEPSPARVAAVVAGIKDEIWKTLESHPWPGNVRELRNAIERAMILGKIADRPVAPPVEPGPAPDVQRPFIDEKADAVARFEAAYVKEALRAHGGNITQAALGAAIDRSYFKRLMKKHGLDG